MTARKKEKWTDDDSAMQEQAIQDAWEDWFIDESPFFDDALEAWNGENDR